MDWKSKWESGLGYQDYLSKHANEQDAARWRSVHSAMDLGDPVREMLRSWTRKMPVLVMSGAWCGDCAEQCPLFEKIENENPLVEFRFIDRDADAQLAERLQLCGAARVPQAVVLSEDFCFVARSSDKTLAKYRQLAHSAGAFCSSGIVDASSDAFVDGLREWLELFERSQLTLRLSSRLRTIHGD